MSGTLYVVATPIGNLEDITVRALRILREVSAIAAEDTRRTAKLLRHYEITTPTISFHEHNAHRRMPELLERLRQSQSVGLVSDAGTPLLSDPGLELVQACIAAGVPVDPIPGPNAPLTALVASGFTAQPLTIFGFAPRKANARNIWLSELTQIPNTVVFFEAPHRIRHTLVEAGAILGKRPLMVARELTKVHQEMLRGTATDLAERLNNPRGEFTVVVGPNEQVADSTYDDFDSHRLLSEFRHLTESRALTRRQAITELSRRYRRPSREIYETLEAVKGSLP